MTVLMDDLDRVYAPALAPFDGVLDPQQLMKEAERETGLSDWGGERWAEARFRGRLDILCNSLETEANLTPVGRSRAHGRLYAMLCSRLRVLAYRKTWTTEPRLTVPLVGTGLPRSGTSFLQALLAQDPENLVPITGQAMVPVPPPGILPDEARRYELVGRMLTFQGLDAPEVNAIHPFAPDAEDEDVLFQEAACGSLFQAFFNIPSFGAQIHEHVEDYYEWQKGMMQLVQSAQSRDRWVLKAPEYMGNLDILRQSFPGARLFVNHRDPAKVVASIASLYVTFQALNCTGGTDPKYLGPAMLPGLMASVDAMRKWREAHPEEVVVDVLYKQLIADPIGEAERVYAAFGLTLSAKAKSCMESFLAINRHGQSHGGVRHRYTLADFGLTEAAVEEACAEYLEHYGIERESRD